MIIYNLATGVAGNKEWIESIKNLDLKLYTESVNFPQSIDVKPFTKNESQINPRKTSRKFKK